MGKIQLFDDESDKECDEKLKTNVGYAKSYNDFRKKEILSHLKNLPSSDEDDDTTDDDASTDEELINPEFDKEFFKSMAFLKKQDPKKYQEIPQFFSNIDTVEETVKSKKKPRVKPMTIKDFERKIILEHGGKYEEDEETVRPESPTIIQEQEQLRKSLKNALKDSDDSDQDDDTKKEGEWGGMFVKRVKTKEELVAEEETYLKWLAGRRNVNDVINSEDQEQLNPLKEYWSSKRLDQDDAFLKDYILNKRYIENNEIPTYDEIVGGVSEDEEELDRQEEYEQKYNFRFEEPDTEFIKRFPRVIDNSVRVTPANKRKEQRTERKERKKMEKEQKMRDLDELKKFRQQEIKERIEKLKLISGTDHLAVNAEELDEEFDPEEHDRKMAAMFNDEYYMIDEGEEKPEYPDLDRELAIENWDNVDKETILNAQTEEENDHCENDEFNMDADYDPEAAKRETQKELIDITKGKRKRRKRLSKFAETLKEEKPAFDPDDERTFAEYIDEYYKLEYEDIIGDQPCRFKYTETVPNDFGLSVQEILMASNKELNRWASLKKAVQNRPEHIEKNDVRLYQQRSKNEMLKRKILPSLYELEPEEADEEVEDRNQDQEKEKELDSEPPKDLKKKVKRKKNKQVADTKDSTVMEPIKLANADVLPPKNKKKQKKTSISEFVETDNLQSVEATSEKNKTKKRKNSEPLDLAANEVKKVKLDQNGERKQKQNKSKEMFKSKDNNRNKVQNQKGDKSVSDDRLRAFGINPKKFHNKQKYHNRNKNKTKFNPNKGQSNKNENSDKKKTQKK